MKEKVEKYSVGVIVARFQVHQLTEAHKEIIQRALDNHPKVIIYLGLSPLKNTTSNPLDFSSRKSMVLEEFPAEKYPNLSIFYIKDQPDDKVWSNNLDGGISDHLTHSDSVILYGGRDSFLQHYCGRFDAKELESTSYVSGSEIRKQLSQAPQNHPLFRAGMVFASYQKYPQVLATCDICAYNPKTRQILLARKSEETNYRFVGGFASPGDDSYEVTALRELAEETGLTAGLDGLHYVGSKKVDDFRFRSCSDKIITHLYFAYCFGAAKANDDIAEAKWFNMDEVNSDIFVDVHKPLWEILSKWIKENVK